MGARRGWLRLAAGLGAAVLLLLLASGPITPPQGAEAFATRSPDCISNDCGSVDVAFIGDGSGVVLAGPSNQIHCTDTAGVPSGTCHWIFTWKGPAGTEIAMVATPATGNEVCPSSSCDPEGQAYMINYSLGPGDDLTIKVEFEPGFRSLTLSFSGSGSGTVTSDPGPVSCPPSCGSFLLQYGLEMTLTATAAPGSRFVGWSGGCAGTAPCKLTLTSNTTVGARFSLGSPATPTSTPGQPTAAASAAASPRPSPSPSSLTISTAAPATAPTVAAADAGVPIGIVALLVVLALACGGLLVALVALLRRGRGSA